MRPLPDSVNFWKKQINLINWLKKPKLVLQNNSNNFKKWFSDGKLNVFHECIEKNINNGLGKKTAIYFVDKNFSIKKISYNEIKQAVNYLTNFLVKNYKINSKSRIMIHASASFESAIAMLSCAKMGIFQSVIFEDLKKEAIKTRIKIFKPNLIISRDNDENIKKNFKDIANQKKNKFSLLIFRKQKTLLKYNFLNSTDVLKHKINSKTNLIKLNSNRKFFTLFTSGSTGEPKGIIHSTGGYLLYSKFTCKKYFGMNEKSIVLTASDAGWINGHTYALYGPLSFGSTTILVEKPMLLLDINFLKKIIKKLKISILYLPVTLIRLLKSVAENKKIKSKYLLTIGSMGEPLAPSVGKWYAKFFKINKPIVNTYFQTETGAIITAPKYNSPLKKNPHGTVGKPSKIFGMNLKKNLKTNKGEILLKNSWPGCMIDVINGRKVWDKYWTEDGQFKLFDIGSFDKFNNLNIHGRNDDVINIRGHRVGSEEVESIVLKINQVSEVSAIAIKDKLESSKIILFVVLKKKLNENKEVIKKKINSQIINYFGSYAIPEKIFIINSLPKTRSGKILRRILRDIVIKPLNKSLGDLSTLLDKNSVIEVRKVVSNEK